MSKWITFGVGAASLFVFGTALSRGIKEAKAHEIPLHSNPDYVQFIQHDDDLKYILQKFTVWKTHHPTTFDAVLYHCNQLLGAQLWCETKHEGYRTYADRAKQHQIGVFTGIDTIREWLMFNLGDNPNATLSVANFDECKTELLAKCSDYMHNINLVVLC